MSATAPAAGSHPRPARSVLISGASIAGPALAHWLHRYGFTVTVVERAPELRTGGYKVDIRGAAVEVAERMGILEDIQRASTDMQTGAYVDGEGKRIATLPADIFGARIGRDDEIMRGDLARILYDRTRSDVEYLFGDSIAAIGPATAEGVEVTFERGAPRRFDIVVGADGVHSNVRRLAFGPEERFARHLGSYISVFSLPNELGLDREELYHALPNRLICEYSSAGDPTAKGMMSFRALRTAYDHRDKEQQLALLAAQFEGSGGWNVPRLLQAARRAPDFYFDGLQLIEMDRWSSGRVVLLGDAAHCASPASGQGTGMALVGAYVLAGELAAADGDPTVAFDRYEKEMRGYVTANHRLAEKFVTEMNVSTRGQIRRRHLMLRILPHMPWKKLVAKKIAEEVQRGANAITLKDYAAVPGRGSARDHAAARPAPEAVRPGPQGARTSAVAPPPPYAA